MDNGSAKADVLQAARQAVTIFLTDMASFRQGAVYQLAQPPPKLKPGWA